MKSSSSASQAAGAAITRRELVKTAAALGAVALFGHPAAARTEDEAEIVPLEPPRHTLEERLKPILAGRTPRKERLTLDMPKLAEDGGVVPVTIAVKSPMTEADYIQAVYLLVDKNPDPLIFSARLRPSLGAVEWRWKIRMAESSTVRAIAETNGGELFTGETDVEVTLSGCG